MAKPNRQSYDRDGVFYWTIVIEEYNPSPCGWQGAGKRPLKRLTDCPVRILGLELACEMISPSTEMETIFGANARDVKCE